MKPGEDPLQNEDWIGGFFSGVLLMVIIDAVGIGLWMLIHG